MPDVARPQTNGFSPASASGSVPAPAYELGEKVATRVAYGTALAKLGAVDPRVVALDGDTKNSDLCRNLSQGSPGAVF